VLDNWGYTHTHTHTHTLKICSTYCCSLASVVTRTRRPNVACILTFLLYIEPAEEWRSYRQKLYTTRLKLTHFTMHYTHFTQAPLSCHRPLANVILLHQKENYDLPFTDLYKTRMCFVVLFADILSRIRLRSYNKCGKCIQKFMYAPNLFMDFTPSNKRTNVKVKSNPITGLDRP
jgi:hypothetical protein